MALYDYISENKPLPASVPAQIDSLHGINTYVQLVKRIEKRAMEAVKEKYPYMLELAGNNPVMIDPYGAPDDSPLWMELFIMAHENRELYARLFFMRGGGTRLIRHLQWGFVFEPVIGPTGWESMEQYNQEKQCLEEYKNEIIKLLKKLGGADKQ